VTAGTLARSTPLPLDDADDWAAAFDMRSPAAAEEPIE
jgi:hypothetical protein